MSLVDIMRRKNTRQEPPPLEAQQQPQLPFSPEVASFIDHTTRQREELAYFKHHAGQIEQDLKVANERIRMLERELEWLRDERDQLYRHDHNMLGGLGAIKAASVNLEEQSRAQAYAPPATGQQQQPEETEQDRQITAGLAERLAPEPRDA